MAEEKQMRGLLGLDPLSAATANQGMLAQALRSRSKPPMQMQPLTAQGLLDGAALATSPVPILGDLIGLGADANRFYNEPESRTPLNFGLAALGLLPFVPPVTGAAKKSGFSDWWKTQFDESTHRNLPADYFPDFQVRDVSPKSELFKRGEGFDIYRSPYGWFEAVKNGKAIGYADNGAIQVSPDFQKMGIGVELLKTVKESNPSHVIGNHTPQGGALARSYFNKYVADK